MKFGKVHWIEAKGSIQDVYNHTKEGMLPQTFFLIGPKTSGKTTLGTALADRCNMKHFNFPKIINDSGLKKKDDETKTLALIKYLINETNPRILLEDFP